MSDEVTTQPRRRGRKRLKESPAILVHDSGRRVVSTPRGRHTYVEAYTLVNVRTLEEVIGRLTAPELRRCIDQESASPTKKKDNATQTDVRAVQPSTRTGGRANKKNRSGSAAAPKPIYYYFSLGTERVSHVRTGYTGAYEGQISSLRRSLLQIGGDATIS
jgi:hypothetical protein